MGAAAATKKRTNALLDKYNERNDPKARHVDGVGLWTELLNRDPARHYMMCNENSGHYDIEFYLGLAPGLGLDEDDGYRVERERDGGVKLRAGTTTRGNDDILRWRGMVVISCPKEFKKLLEEIGDDGHGGQRAAEQLDAMVGRRKAFENPQVNVVSPNGTQYLRPMTQTELEQG
jgi:hypothetical protein